jgi:branched-chain amino acid transport system ATP-binding protein
MILLSIQNLSKNFGGLQAVDKFNLELNEGEIVSLIGPNGAGKTTIFNLLTGVYPADEGEMLFQGTNLRNLKPYDVCKKGIGRTFQVVKPFLNRTVLYNVTVGALLKSANITEAECEARDILKFSGLISKKSMLAKSLTIADRKRLEIARALATKPKLLLLDETMAGLTPTETEMAINLIRKISKEKNLTIFLIEHVMQVVMSLSDRVVVLNYGKKIAEDAPLNISKDEKVIKAYLGEEYVVTT